MTNGVSSYFTSLYALPIIAASTIQSQRSGMMVGVLSSVMYAGVVVLRSTSGPPALPVVGGRAAAAAAGRAVHRRAQHLRVHGGCRAERLSGRTAPAHRRAAGAGGQAAGGSARVQRARHQQLDERPRDDRHRRPDSELQQGGGDHHGRDARHALQRSASEVLQLPSEFARLFGSREGRPRLPRVEYVFKCPDGREIELGISTAILRTPRGEVGFVFTFQDVTEARKQEREARIQQRLAAVGEMAAGIAHEIRNPLASMSGSLQILRQELPLSEEQSLLMDIVLRESDRLNETIRSFLDYARPQRNAFARLDVRQVLTETATLLQNSPELLEAHEIRCDVPPAPVWCLADEAQIRQIVWNLATNGLRSMAEGGRADAARLDRAGRRRQPGAGGDVGERRRHRHRARRVGRHPATVPRPFRPRHRVGAVDRVSNRQRLRRRPGCDLAARPGHNGHRHAAGGEEPAGERPIAAGARAH